MAAILKGAPVAAAVYERARASAESLRARGVSPKLAVVRLGENDADVYYERSIIKCCAKAGVEAERIILPASTGEGELLELVDRLNRDESIHGVLIFRPLPRHIDDGKVRDRLSPEKDVDGITDASLGGIFTGSGRGFAPCTAEACMEMLRFYGVGTAGKRACVIGRSLVIGKPVSQLLMAENATVTVCHTKTRALAEETARADILIAAAGRAKAVSAEHVSPGQVVIDVGINTDEDGKMCGDVDFAAAEPTVGAITPVPGGVGTVTTALLCEHVVRAAERAVKRG